MQGWLYLYRVLQKIGISHFEAKLMLKDTVTGLLCMIDFFSEADYLKQTDSKV